MKKEKNAFTLVELLATIVILAVILVIAVPKVITIIDDVKEGTLETTAKMIASSAEKAKVQNEVLDINKEITCENVSKLNDIDYERCHVEFDGNKALVDIKGSGKFEGMYVCKGTKDNADVTERCPNEKVLVTFSLNGGSIEENGETITGEVTKIYKEGTFIDISIPTKENNTFQGWNVVKGDSVFDGNTNKLIVGENDTILHAMWQTNPIITIDYDNGEENYSERHVTNTTIELVTPTKENYKFVRWNKISGNSTLSGNTLTIGTEDTKVKAIWELNVFNLSIDLDGGNVSESQEGTYKVGESINLVTPTKEGYEFSSWELITDNESGILSGDSFTMGVKDAEIKAIYTPIEYTMSYTLNGGTVSNIDKYTIETETFTLNNPNKTGYTFTGWTGSNGETPEMSVTITKGSTGNKTYTANWELINPVDSYSCSNGSSGSSPYVFTYSGDCTMINDGSGNWRLKFLTSGTFTSSINLNIDVFLVGGGGGGANGRYDSCLGGGGGGGYTKTYKGVSVALKEIYTITIGAGGNVGCYGGTTSAFGYSAAGGANGQGAGTSGTWDGGAGGSGGGGDGGGGGSDGSNGIDGGSTSIGGGRGQQSTTREFGEAGATLYAGGGGGGGINGYGGAGGGGAGGYYGAGVAGTPNTGGGGGGGATGTSSVYGAAGGSGIVVIRNKR